VRALARTRARSRGGLRAPRRDGLGHRGCRRNSARGASTSSSAKTRAEWYAGSVSSSSLGRWTVRRRSEGSSASSCSFRRSSGSSKYSEPQSRGVAVSAMHRLKDAHALDQVVFGTETDTRSHRTKRMLSRGRIADRASVGRQPDLRQTRRGRVRSDWTIAGASSSNEQVYRLGKLCSERRRYAGRFRLETSDGFTRAVRSGVGNRPGRHRARPAELARLQIRVQERLCRN